MSRQAASKNPREDVALMLADPLCVRFNTGDLARVARAASKGGLPRSVWIREIALSRAALVLANKRPEPLVEDKTKRGPGEQVCVRFRPDEWTLVLRASKKEAWARPSPWIRALVMQRVDRGEGEHGSSGSSNGNGSGNGEAQRERVKDGSAAPVRVVGLTRRKVAARDARHPQGT